MNKKIIICLLALVLGTLIGLILVSATQIGFWYEQVDQTQYKLVAGTNSTEVDSYMTFYYRDGSWHKIETDTHPTDVGDHYEWYGFWETETLDPDTYSLKANWYDVNDTLIAESPIQSIQIGTPPPPPTSTPPPTYFIDVTSSKVQVVQVADKVFKLYCKTEQTVPFEIHNYSTDTISNLHFTPSQDPYAIVMLNQHVIDPNGKAGGVIHINRGEIEQDMPSYPFKLYGKINTDSEELATFVLNIKEHEEQEEEEYEGDIRELSSADISPLCNGRTGELIYEGDPLEIVIDTSDLTIDEIHSLYVFCQTQKKQIRSAHTSIYPRDIAYGDYTYVFLKQKTNTYYPIHTWKLWRPKRNLEYKYTVHSDAGTIIFTSVSDPDTLKVTIPDTKYEQGKIFDNQETLFIKENGTYTFTIEAVQDDAYSAEEYTTDSKEFDINMTEPTTPPPTTVAPTTVPPTTAPTTAPHPLTTQPPEEERDYKKYIPYVLIIIGIGVIVYKLKEKKEKDEGETEEKQEKKQTKKETKDWNALEESMNEGDWEEAERILKEMEKLRGEKE